MPNRADYASSAEYNQALIDEFRANDGKLSGEYAQRRVLLLTTTGAKSGRKRTTPLGFVPLEDGRVVLAAAAGGSPRHPDWYFNLTANPDVEVEVPGERYHARANVLDDPERTRYIEEYFSKSPAFVEYLEKAGRAIPLVALERA